MALSPLRLPSGLASTCRQGGCSASRATRRSQSPRGIRVAAWDPTNQTPPSWGRPEAPQRVPSAVASRLPVTLMAAPAARGEARRVSGSPAETARRGWWVQAERRRGAAGLHPVGERGRERPRSLSRVPTSSGGCPPWRGEAQGRAGGGPAALSSVPRAGAPVQHHSPQTPSVGTSPERYLAAYEREEIKTPQKGAPTRVSVSAHPAGLLPQLRDRLRLAAPQSIPRRAPASAVPSAPSEGGPPPSPRQRGPKQSAPAAVGVLGAAAVLYSA